MRLLRYLNRVIIGAIMFPFFFLIFLPIFMYMDWLFEENKDDYASLTITSSFWKLFKWNQIQETE